METCKFCSCDGATEPISDEDGNEFLICEKCDEEAFTKKLTKDELDVLLHDLECLELKDTTDNKYHYDLLRNNLLGLGGRYG